MRRMRIVAPAALLLTLLTACAATAPPPAVNPRRPLINGREEQRRMMLADENGRIAPDGLVKALAHVKRMRALTPIAETAGIGRNSWTWLGPGNIGGRVTTILVHPSDPNRMLVNNPGGGIWKTSNGGETWSPVDDFLGNLAVSTLAMSPTETNILYAGTGGGAGGSLLRGAGIFKSTDGGNTWAQLPSTAASDWSGGVEKISFSPDGGIVLAATKSFYSDVASTLWRSTDGGTSWTETLKAPGTEASWVEFHPTNGGLAIASLKSGEALLSTDGGVTWNLSTGIPAEGLVTVRYALSNPSVIYAGLDRNGGEIFKSTDGGRTYSLVNTGTRYLGDQGWYSNVVWVDPTNPDVVLIAGLDIYRSTDGGVTFIKVSRWQKAPDSAHADHGAIAAAGGYDGRTNKAVLFGNDGGLYRAPDVFSVEEEAGWQPLNNNLGVTQIYGAAANASGIIMAGTQDNGSIRYGGDAQKWSKWQGGDGGFIAADPTDPNVFYGEYVYLTIYRSEDGGFATPDDIYGLYYYWNGSGWEKKARANPITEANAGTANFIAPFILDPNNPNRLLAGARSLWVTDNARIPKAEGWPEWRAVKPPAGNQRANNISAIAVAKGSSDRIWVGHNNGDVFVTTSGTAASPGWTKVDDGSPALPNRYVNRIAVDPRDSNVVYVAFGGFTANNLWKTTDGGTTWTSVTGSGGQQLPNAPIESIAIHPNNSRWLYAGTEVGVFTSEDGGATWNVPQDGPANVSVKELFWWGTTLHAATFGRGLYKVAIPGPSKTALHCYTLAVAVDDASRGGVVAGAQPDCNHGTQYTEGSMVRLRARPHAPNGFAGWGGDVSSESRTVTVTMDRDRRVSATFTATAACSPFRVTIVPPNSGTVTLDPPTNCTSGYFDGTEVTFRAVAGNGYVFGGWFGAYFDVDPIGSVKVDGPVDLIAVFARPAPNDDIANAVDLASATEVIFDTSNATNAPDDPDTCAAGKSGKTVWFRYTPTDDGALEIDTSGSNYDTVVQVYTGSRGALRTVVCSADGFAAQPIVDYGTLATDELAAVRVPVKKGVAYTIEIGDSTEPVFEQQHEFALTEDLLDAPDGGLLVVNAQFTKATPRRRSVRH